jgi:hypothetical protein
MRHVWTAFAAALCFAFAGCSALPGAHADKSVPPPKASDHPSVVIQGVDGTMLAGELLNGSVTIDSGQGELTLLTDHIHSITLAQDVDKIDSDSVKITGKIKDPHFLLRNEHGVITLMKERLKKIDFVANPPPAVATMEQRPSAIRSTAPVR